MKTYLLTMFAVLPFVIGAIIHFFDAWIWVPAALVLGMYWLGVCISIGEPEMTPCEGCRYRSSLWGMEYCLIGKWVGKVWEKICSEYRRNK